MSAGQRRARFRQADMARALKAAVAAGMNPAQIVLEPTGEMRLIFTDSTQPDGLRNPLDRLLEDANT